MKRRKDSDALGLEGDNRLAGALTRYFLAILSPGALPGDPYFEGERVGALLRGRSSGDENEDCVLFWRAWSTTYDSRIAVQLSEILIKDNQFDAVEKIVARALRNDHVPDDIGMRLRHLAAVVAQRRKADWSEGTGSRDGVAGSARGLEWPLWHARVDGSRSIAASSVAKRSTSPMRGKQDRNAVAVNFHSGGSAVTGRTLASKHHASSEPPRIGREEQSPGPAQGPSSRCDVAALRASQNFLLAKERVSVLQALRMQYGNAAFGSTLDAEPEERVLLPVVACRTEDPETLRASLERVLLRREVWHYRSAPLQAARLSPSPDVRQRAEKLAALRSVRSQLRLRDFEDVSQQLEKKPLPHTLEWPADTEPVQATTDDLEYTIRQIEIELATTPLESSGPKNFETLWSQLLLGLGKDGVLLAYLPVSTSPTETQVAAAIVTGDGTISLKNLGEERQIFHGLGESAVLDRSLDLGRELQRLRAKLFDPIERRLINKRRVFLLDSGLARFLPWRRSWTPRAGFSVTASSSPGWRGSETQHRRTPRDMDPEGRSSWLHRRIRSRRMKPHGVRPRRSSCPYRKPRKRSTPSPLHSRRPNFLSASSERRRGQRRVCEVCIAPRSSILRRMDFAARIGSPLDQG